MEILLCRDSTQGSRYTIFLFLLFPIPSFPLPSSFLSLSLRWEYPSTSASHIRFVFFPVDPSTGKEKNNVNAFSLSPPISTLLLHFCSCPSFSCLRSIFTTDANTDRSFCSLKSSMTSRMMALLADAVQGLWVSDRGVFLVFALVFILLCFTFPCPIFFESPFPLIHLVL